MSDKKTPEIPGYAFSLVDVPEEHPERTARAAKLVEDYLARRDAVMCRHFLKPPAKGKT